MKFITLFCLISAPLLSSTAAHAGNLQLCNNGSIDVEYSSIWSTRTNLSRQNLGKLPKGACLDFGSGVPIAFAFFARDDASRLYNIEPPYSAPSGTRRGTDNLEAFCINPTMTGGDTIAYERGRQIWTTTECQDGELVVETTVTVERLFETKTTRLNIEPQPSDLEGRKVWFDLAAFVEGEMAKAGSGALPDPVSAIFPDHIGGEIVFAFSKMTVVPGSIGFSQYSDTSLTLTSGGESYDLAEVLDIYGKNLKAYRTIGKNMVFPMFLRDDDGSVVVVYLSERIDPKLFVGRYQPGKLDEFAGNDVGSDPFLTELGKADFFAGWSQYEALASKLKFQETTSVAELSRYFVD